MSKLVASHLFATAIAGVALAMPTVAPAHTLTVNQQTAFVESFLDSPDGCLIVNLFITQATQSAPPSVTSLTSVSINRDFFGDDCATHIAAGGGLVLTIASGNSDQAPLEFTINQRLTTATLKITIPVLFFATGAEGSVVADLVFSGIEGTLSPDRSHQTFPGSAHGPVVIHTRGYTRAATASGSMSDGTTDYFANAGLVRGSLGVSQTHQSGPRPQLLH